MADVVPVFSSRVADIDKLLERICDNHILSLLTYIHILPRSLMVSDPERLSPSGFERLPPSGQAKQRKQQS